MKNQKIAYSILELALISEGTTPHQTFVNSVQLAKEAEALGYHRIWFAEHHNMKAVGSNAPSILIGHIAQQTTKIRVGAGGVMLPNHSPLIVAEQFGTLGTLFPNRIDLGLGRAPGTDRETAAAIKTDFLQSASSFPNDLEQIQQYFSTTNTTAKVRAPIAEGVNVPIYILGSSTDSAHLAAKKGLPYAFASHFAPTHLEKAIEIYRSEFTPSSRLNAPYIIPGINAILADTDAEAERLYTSSLRMIIGMMTGKREYIPAPTPMTSELRAIAQHPSIQQMIKYAFVGSKHSVKSQIKSFLNHTMADEIMVSCTMYDPQDRLKSIHLFAEIMDEINTDI
ncbi:LLM class flavin-dependent oxidoreductase [Flavobacteriaceae bacterium F08102]|nr:LLM class flavin-dependent oxidoreductase [Flavobacteriaceae bacterium F08102]